jgi:hypothetical protein
MYKDDHPFERLTESQLREKLGREDYVRTHPIGNLEIIS